MIPEKKICGICGVEKPKDAFSIRRKPNGYCWLRMECMLCENINRRIRYKTVPGLREKKLKQSKDWSSRNREKLLAYFRRYEIENKVKNTIRHKKKYENNKEKIKADRRAYYRKNPQKHIAIVNEYSKKNRHNLLAKKRENHKKRRAIDEEYRITKILRTRVTAAIKNRGVKCLRTKELIGCTVPYVISYLESMFKDGMSWDNHSVHGWHVDHIIPCAAFDLTNPEEQKKCFHYTNLQPLWGIDNMRKGARLTA